ncbi:hypothetical protein JCM11491_003918 [Sporobolomyces phaffii]
MSRLSIGSHWAVYQQALNTLKAQIDLALPQKKPGTALFEPKKTRRTPKITASNSHSASAESCINFVALLELAFAKVADFDRVYNWEVVNNVAEEQRILHLIAFIGAKLMAEDKDTTRYVQDAELPVQLQGLPAKVAEIKKQLSEFSKSPSLGKRYLGHRAERIYGIASDAWTR